MLDRNEAIENAQEMKEEGSVPQMYCAGYSLALDTD